MSTSFERQEPWVKRCVHAVAHSIKLRLVVVFLLLAFAMSAVFVVGAQRAFTVGWKEAARPLLMDYVDHLAADITRGGASPDQAAALALTKRLPLTVDIQGPSINWESHPGNSAHGWQRNRWGGQRADGTNEDWGSDKNWQAILQRATLDGHTIVFGIDETAFAQQSRHFGVAIGALLLLTTLAWLYVRRLLRPLDAISAGAKRFGAGNFNEPIDLKCRARPDELSQLAGVMNTMGQDIRQMLDAKRALLLAISHELRSPLTRARLNTELLPETTEVNPQREALLRDLQEMASLISDLLESERLATQHAALNRETVDLSLLARSVIEGLQSKHPQAAHVSLHTPVDLPAVQVDCTRIRLLLRNLLDNALRHSADATPAPELHLRPVAGGGVEIEVRDFGPGVPEDQIGRMAEPFFRPDSARTRSAGGVGLGLYLCKLVAQAHGGSCVVRNVHPGLSVVVKLAGS
ncbi:HAMP domain-containing sensor histidine kinase [Hydrogenophaga sp. PAMC20947]|uniref:HAMP domain-containing sensor histidine kinase n=1 Tax=Hydrogenophaga sp. PAMC20947 TaxID=2565558 RepID=UPI00109DC036|nr:HAMP domain-containing sensor histidine kinase [Hydrogenophaga sp. PAMC20947]QCB46090.1 HAMP domain-containing histidine kinase [Hydrogenophaga sp. PAMC20947]